MSDSRLRSVVSVQIAGEEYTIRADASGEYTRECAAYVDRTIQEILSSTSMVQAHKASVLAALAITDQLFRVRRELDEFRKQADRRADRLAVDIGRRLGPDGLASPS